MGYFCNLCNETITFAEYNYSRQKFNKALCRNHQNNQRDIKQKGYTSKRNSPTQETKQLGYALQKRGWKVEYEKKDGFKSIDIAITEAKVNIEVDGSHHNFSDKQALADLKRTFYSFKKGFLTLRIPNSLVKDKNTLEQTADYIDGFLNESVVQMENDNDFW